VGTRFAWDTQRLGPHFSISPAEGYLAPQHDVKLNVTFHPGCVDADIRVQGLVCTVRRAWGWGRVPVSVQWVVAASRPRS
jgi:hypothetical protein